MKTSQVSAKAMPRISPTNVRRKRSVFNQKKPRVGRGPAKK